MEWTCHACRDGADNDHDGFTDCDDYDCSRNPAVTVCSTGGVEDTDARCNDGVDNDHNGHLECDDYDCSRNPAVSICSGGVEGPESFDDVCTDRFDNDGDGHIDCDDHDCSRNPEVTVCGGGGGGAGGDERTEALCTDGADNDGDGFRDCDDHDCDRNPRLAACGAICPGRALELVLTPVDDGSGTTVPTARASSAFAGKASAHRSGRCLWDDGEEVIFHVVAPVPGRLWVEADFDLAIDSEIYLFAGQCGGVEPRTDCRRATDLASTHSRSYWDDVQAGVDLYVVVDHAADGPDPAFDVVIQVFPAE